MAARRKITERHHRPVAFCNEVVREDLPLPVVHYPIHYGTTIEFSADEDGQKYLCSCYIPSLKAGQIWRQQWNEEMGADWAIPSLDAFKFKEAICHICQHRVPSHRWCHEMYGRPFVQDYGWYLNMLRSELGVPQNGFIPDLCPSEILSLVQIDPRLHFKKQAECVKQNPDGARELEKQYQQQERQIARAVENRLRLRLGLHQVGRPSIGERTLHEFLIQLFSQDPVYRCMRPTFLEGLEFDFWIPTRNVAIEYQGVQHFVAVSHWGGTDGLAKLKERDAKKKAICQNRGITLVEFHHDEDLAFDVVVGRIKSASNPAIV